MSHEVILYPFHFSALHVGELFQYTFEYGWNKCHSTSEPLFNMNRDLPPTPHRQVDQAEKVHNFPTINSDLSYFIWY